MNSNDVETIKPLSKFLKIIIKAVDVCSSLTFYKLNIIPILVYFFLPLPVIYVYMYI